MLLFLISFVTTTLWLYWEGTFGEDENSAPKFRTDRYYGKVLFAISAFTFLEAHWMFSFQYLTTSIWLPKVYYPLTDWNTFDQMNQLIFWWVTGILVFTECAFGWFPNSMFLYCLNVVIGISITIILLISLLKIRSVIRVYDKQELIKISEQKMIVHLVLFTLMMIGFLA